MRGAAGPHCRVLPGFAMRGAAGPHSHFVIFPEGNCCGCLAGSSTRLNAVPLWPVDPAVGLSSHALRQFPSPTREYLPTKIPISANELAESAVGGVQPD
eukprot:NODE_1658_length_1340_cov_8.895430_g1374_i0.p3 GENE.NODE_1658_length_1340_cov_8.895430_g1374_i0~~NODE_1658_length_1340_cov_8.895430_g1374_i0.p3  ORF type:complete len:99 (+),score=0.08 NODE_1658_length_1340_cov_8.895430_g1374_i0:497-793(+)